MHAVSATIPYGNLRRVSRYRSARAGQEPVTRRIIDELDLATLYGVVGFTAQPIFCDASVIVM